VYGFKTLSVGFFGDCVACFLDGLALRPFTRLSRARDGDNPGPLALHGNIAEVGPPDRRKHRVLEPDKELLFVGLPVEGLYLLLLHGLREEDVGGGQDAPVHGHEVGGEVHPSPRSQPGHLLFHLGEVSVPGPFIRGYGISNIRIVSGIGGLHFQLLSMRLPTS
jgi:hypothetical protein